MNSNSHLWKATLLTAVAVLTASTNLSIASAADEATSAQMAPPPGPGGMHHRGGPWHLLSKLDLNATQKQQIKEIMTAARPQMEALHQQMHANSLKLQQTQPTDANYSSISSAVSQTHGSLSAQMMSQHAEVRAQIFKVLTPAQQTQLATLEAQMQAQHAAHGARGPHPDGPPPAD